MTAVHGSALGQEQNIAPGLTLRLPAGMVSDEGFLAFCQYSANGDIQTVHFDDLLDGGDVLPGFTLRLADLISV